ncbi:MAG: hypothetical protein LBS52_04760 [Dysgonamonadaceae bacterium]|jgi:hypothetical protein|nr:hypothetical protein [Dysgonamonadaceae bacterium]
MRNLKELTLRISAVLILLSAMIYFFFPLAVVPWVMAVAVVAFSTVIASSPYPGKSLRGRRLFNFQLLACVCFGVATYLMFILRNEWFLALIVGAILLLYASIAMPKEFEKEKKTK